MPRKYPGLEPEQGAELIWKLRTQKAEILVTAMAVYKAYGVTRARRFEREMNKVMDAMTEAWLAVEELLCEQYGDNEGMRIAHAKNFE